MMDDIKSTGTHGAGGSSAKPAKIPPKTDKPEPAFAPPEKVAERDEFVAEAAASTDNEPLAKAVTKRRLRLPRLSRKQWLIAAAVSTVFIGGGVIYGLRVFRKPPPPAPVVKKEVKPEPVKPTTGPSKLTGIEVKLEINDLPITGMMIENSPDARPQAGLKDAGVVYEAIAEGGITRFLALYLEGQPAKIGPVRSVRPYYLDFLVPYDAAIGHAGGSGQALAEIRDQGIKDLDHGPNGGSFQRSAARFSPHNLYTSYQQMLDLQRSKGFASKPISLLRKKEAPSPTPNAKSIELNISGPLYAVRWDYDAATNSYNRAMAGRPHLDENGGQITSKVVVVPVMSHRYEGIYSVYDDHAGGKVYIFQDGIVTEGTWTKANRPAQFEFKDANGQPIGLNPGQTWFTIVNSFDDVVYRP